MSSEAIPDDKPLPPLLKRFEYHVVFSYASEEAKYVEEVDKALPKEVLRFSYRAGEEILWGRRLKKHLKHLYRRAGLFCVVFGSKAYADKRWTTYELKYALQKGEYLLPARFDEAQLLPGLDPDTVYIDVGGPHGKTPEQLAALIVNTIRRPPPKPWWYYVTRQTIVAVAAALLAILFLGKPTVDLFRPSKTSVALTSASERAVTAHISNKGPKASTLVGYRLKFGELPIEDAELRLDNSDAATIPPRTEVDVDLKVWTLLPKCMPDGTRLNNLEMEPLLDQRLVTLEIDVQESDDLRGKPSTRRAPFPASRLKPFVGKWVPGDADGQPCF